MMSLRVLCRHMKIKIDTPIARSPEHNTMSQNARETDVENPHSIHNSIIGKLENAHPTIIPHKIESRGVSTKIGGWLP